MRGLHLCCPVEKQGAIKLSFSFSFDLSFCIYKTNPFLPLRSPTCVNCFCKELLFKKESPCARVPKLSGSSPKFSFTQTGTTSRAPETTYGQCQKSQLSPPPPI